MTEKRTYKVKPGAKKKKKKYYVPKETPDWLLEKQRIFKENARMIA